MPPPMSARHRSDVSAERSRMNPDPNDRAYWDRLANKYDRSMRILGRPLPRMLELVAAELEGAGDVLEVAAGTGLVTVVAARTARRVVATDYSSSMLDVLRDRLEAERIANVEIAQADVEALEYAESSFDAVVAANVLHLVPDLDAALREMARVLRPGGTLIVPTFCHAETVTSQVFSRLMSIASFPGRRRLAVEGLTSAVRDAGLEPRVVETIRGLLPIGFVSARKPS